MLAEHAKHRAGPRQDSDALLAGKLFDDRGDRMSPSHATKGGRRYRYYVSQAILQGRQQDAGSLSRVAAMEIERRVVEAVRGTAPSDHLERSIGRPSIQRVYGHPGADVAAIGIDATASASSSCALDLDLRCSRRARDDPPHDIGGSVYRRDGRRRSGSRPRHSLDAAVPLSTARDRSGGRRATRCGATMRTKARAILIDALRDAHRWLDELTTDSNHTIESIAAREKKTERSIRLTMSLALWARLFWAKQVFPKAHGASPTLVLLMFFVCTLNLRPSAARGGGAERRCRRSRHVRREGSRPPARTNRLLRWPPRPPSAKHASSAVTPCSFANPRHAMNKMG